MQSKLVIDIRPDETRIDAGGFRISAFVRPFEGQYQVSFKDPFKSKPELAETYPDFLAALIAAAREFGERARKSGVELSGLPDPFGI
jgi:hypothetical protein